MAEHTAAPQPNDSQARYENDVNAGAIARLALSLVIIVAVALVVLVWIFNFFSARETHTGHSVSRAAPAAIEIPPAPSLQISPRSDLEEMLAAEQKQLDGYGWVDKDKGIVRIPIERAMDLIAQRGLPARKR